MSTYLADFPYELRFLICAHVYAAGLPPKVPTLDPLYVQPAGAPTAQPSSYPPSCWTEPVSRSTLFSLSLVDRAWSNAARPWLWRRIEVRLPRSWLALVHEVAGDLDEDAAFDATAQQIGSSIQEAAEAAVHAKDPSSQLDDEAMKQMRDAILESIASGPDSAIPVDLLSPPASREPSRYRRQASKSKSPARWKLMRSISDAVQTLLGDGTTYNIADVRDRQPGRFIQHLDFNHFRTIGMRRSIDEGVNSRFVTGERLEALLREMPNLATFGATEYMDGALTFSVLKELLLRGRVASGRNHPARGRSLVDDSAWDADDEEAPRRRDCRELEALDASGCVSAVFVNALAEFARSCLSDAAGAQLALVGLQRLSLRGARSVAPHTLHTFTLACPNLTALDLSGTRIEPGLLECLAASQTVHLRALALGRCVRLTGESLHDFLVCAPAAWSVTELSLYGDSTFPCPLDRAQLHAVLTTAPCVTAGKLRYLDLSSAPLDASLLSVLPSQPALRSLGISHIPSLPLHALVSTIPAKMPSLEVLSMIGTCVELTGTPRAAALALHSRLIAPLCMPPFSFARSAPPSPPPTRVRVIELGAPTLTALGRGGGSWRVIKSKGGRGWYVDTASGWIAEPNGDGKHVAGLRRDLEEGHPWRVALEKLADANGNVSSGVGWHARKLEVLFGHGLLGREDGLYGAVSFAYQG